MSELPIESNLPPPIVPVTKEEATKALRKLGLSNDFSVDKILAQKTFGQWLSQPGIGPIAMTATFETLGQVRKASNLAMKIAKGKKTSTKEKLEAISVINQSAKAVKDMVDTALTLAQATGVTVKPPGGKNAPPILGLQFDLTVNNGEKPAASIEVSDSSKPESPD